MKAPSRAAITAVELLVIISIIGLLMALLLPAIQAARERGRITACRNNLRQLAVAVSSHEAVTRRYPSNGWSYVWVGDPDRGTGRTQPGSWLFSMLPYMERADLHRLGKGLAGPAKKAYGARLLESALPVVHCASRRRCELLEYDSTWPPLNADPVPVAAKSDYAINAGDVLISSGLGPATLEQGDDPLYAWADFSKATGVSFMRSEIAAAHIRDGLTFTYLVGEKCVSYAGLDLGDDQSMYSGYDIDTARWAGPSWPPTRDSAEGHPISFGSAHADGFQMAFCDGHVRLLSYQLDAKVHRLLANRADGELLNEAVLAD